MTYRDIKCIFVCHEAIPNPSGGIGSYTFTMAKALAQLGVDVTIVGLYEQTFDREFTIKAPFAAVTVPFWDGKFSRRPLPGLIDRLRLYQKIKAITQTPGRWIVEWPDYQGCWLKPNKRAIEVHKVHGPYFLQPQPGIPSWETIWEARQIRSLETWSSVSHYYADWVCHKLAIEKETFISYIPIDTEIFQPKPAAALAMQHSPQIITFCGNDNPRKRAESLAKAFAQLAAQNQRVQLNFVGKCQTNEQELRSYIPEEFQDRVVFTGVLNDRQIAHLLQRSTVFCLPSEHESFGISWVEAMACGIPVVAGTGSCAEEVITAEAGVFVDPNRPDQLATAIARLLDDPKRCHDMGTRGRELVMSRYHSSIVAQRVLDWYESLWAKRLMN
jgi:glycosyltransferase involved in cell wall biosynthesis